MEKGIDDVLVQGKDKEEVMMNLRQVLEAARKGKLTFSRKKILIKILIICAVFWDFWDNFQNFGQICLMWLNLFDDCSKKGKSGIGVQ